jgi:uncharacterized membrane protein
LKVDLAVGLAALAAMYIPLITPLKGASDWSLYTYWVLVTVCYTCYALFRLRRW